MLLGDGGIAPIPAKGTRLRFYTSVVPGAPASSQRLKPRRCRSIWVLTYRRGNTSGQESLERADGLVKGFSERRLLVLLLKGFDGVIDRSEMVFTFIPSEQRVIVIRFRGTPLLLRQFPKRQGGFGKAQIHEGKGAVVQAVRVVRRCGWDPGRAGMPCERLIDAIEAIEHGSEIAKLRGNTTAKQGLEGHGEFSRLDRLQALVARLPASRPAEGFQDSQRPGIHVHPGFGLRAFDLLLRAIGQGVTTGNRLFSVDQLALGLGQAEICNLGVPCLRQQDIAWLDVLVDQTPLVGVLQSPRSLNGDVQDAGLNLLFRTLVQPPGLDRVLQTAAVHPLGKDRRHAADFADIVAADDMRVEPQVDPVLALRHEISLALIAALGKEPGLGPLHGQVVIPAQVMHPPHAAHAAVDGVVLHAVGLQNIIVPVYLLVGDGFGAHSLPQAAFGVVLIGVPDRIALTDAALRQGVAE